jgi:DNA sulfur modification protein DndE
MPERSTLNLLQLRRRPFVPTKRTEDYTGRLLRQVGLPDKATVGRLALGRSLAEPGHPPPLDGVASEGAGKAIRGDTLFGDDLAAWIALLVEHAAMTDRPEGIDTDTLVDLVRRHWDRGAALIWKDWQEAGHQLWPFVERLATLAALPSEGSSTAVGEGRADPSEWNPSVIHPVLLRLGEIGSIEGTDRRAEWVLNANGRAPHVGMFGKPGKGKTRTAKQLFRQVREAGVPLLIIDPKGELREEAAFVRDIGAEVIGVGREPIPLDALACEPGGEIRVADGFVEALKGAVPQLGPKQLDAAREIVKRLLAANGVVRFEDVVAEVDAHYARSDLKVDVLTASLHKLRDYALFAPTYAPKEFFAKTWVISVNEATDEVLRFALLFLLDSLLRHLRAASEAPVDHVRKVRALRLVLAIDEARRVMEVASPHLMEGLVLECRSKGLSCMFFSQSPDHMDRASDDIVKQLEVVASFEADVESKAVSRFFGSGRKPRDLQQLPTGHLLVRLPGEERAVVVKAWE